MGFKTKEKQTKSAYHGIKNVYRQQSSFFTLNLLTFQYNNNGIIHIRVWFILKMNNNTTMVIAVPK